MLDVKERDGDEMTNLDILNNFCKQAKEDCIVMLSQTINRYFERLNSEDRIEFSKEFVKNNVRNIETVLSVYGNLKNTDYLSDFVEGMLLCVYTLDQETQVKLLEEIECVQK